jgi:TIR domain-containing protein
MHSVFVSYRRLDTSGHAGWLYEHLLEYFGRDHVFMDIDSIPPGADFAKVIDDTIANCEVVLVLIGRDWLTAKDATGSRRLDNPSDPVRLEVSRALESDRKVIPVLVDQAIMPTQEALPDALEGLARCHAHTLGNRTFARDVEQLARAIHGGFLESKRDRSISGTLLIESGTEVKNSRFKFRAFFAQGNEFILTGTNFGDQMGDRDTPPSLLHQLVVSTLKRDPSTCVYLVIAPFELLDMMLPNSMFDLQGRSASRLLMLAKDPRLMPEERARLHIFDHRGATFLSVALRDPNSIDRRGLAVATPRWFSDEAGPQRMFFAIEESAAPEVFRKFIEPLYPRIKVEEKRLAEQPDRTLGGRNIEDICRALGVTEDPFTSKLSAWSLNP